MREEEWDEICGNPIQMRHQTIIVVDPFVYMQQTFLSYLVLSRYVVKCEYEGQLGGPADLREDTLVEWFI